MDLAQLQAIVATGESETLEFKKTTGERREAMQSLCAILNHRGGRVLFGVDRLLSERPGIGRKEILTILNLEVRPLKSDLEDLKRLGLIVQTGKGRGSVWHLVESAANRQ